MPGLGFESWASYVTESTWGTAPGTGEAYARIIDESMKIDPSPKFYPSISGPGRRAKFMGHRRIAGDIKFETHYEGPLSYFLKHAMGSSTPAGTGPYTHTYALTDALPEGINVEISKADIPTGQVFRYDGCLVDRLLLEFNAEEMLAMTVSLIAKERTTGVAASGTPTYVTDNPVLFHHAGTLTVAGTASQSIKSGSILLNNNLDADRFFMSQNISRPKRRTWREITGTAVLELEDVALVDKFALGTQGNMSLVFTDATSTMTVSMAASFLTESEPVINTEGAIELPIAYQAIGGNTEFAVVLINTEATIS